RLILMPLMLHNQKQMAITSMKMKELQPKIEPIQQKMKAAATQQLKNEAYQELQQLYQQHQLNPLTTMFGCLPMLIQIPILLGLYATLKWPTSGGILSHPTFMWFHLTSPDSMMAMIAGFMYFVQSWLSARQMPKEQRMMGYVMMIVSPLFILYIAFQSPSALALYWSVNAASLMLQAIISQRQTHHIRQSKTM
nr:membrane protein insertase YidC [Staphylococcus lugdunensis]